MKPLLITMGEPAGIGAEITASAWRALRSGALTFALIDDADRNFGVPVVRIGSPAEVARVFSSALPILHRPLAVLPTPGEPDRRNAPNVIAAIEEAVALAKAGKAAGMVTNPIQKSVLQAAGFPHAGHTEFLAELAGGDTPPVMMLAASGLRTVPISVHEPLAVALKSLSTERIVSTSCRVAAALRRELGIAKPRLAIAGVNPHAGEGGLLGREDIDIILPAVEELKRRGLNAVGPLPPDAMFSAQVRAGYDVAICHYHDQALIPIKTLDMAGGVNVTLGLSIVRTSPDHGTALDIAGSGKADPSSIVAAIRLAATLAHNRGFA